MSSPAKLAKSVMDILHVAKLSDKAILPTKGSKSAAGYDLYSAYDCTIPARGKALVKTDLQVKVPHGTYGRVAPRSGLAWKNHIDIGAGVVDEDYRGNLGVVMFNHADEEFKIAAGDRIAQLVCEKISYPEMVELPSLDCTERGEGGFGSTGTN
jgi:dUTP pyrophosphatase